MASEPTDEPVSVSLPPDLAEWVDQQAAEADTDRETVLVQLLAAHQATAELDANGDIDADFLAATADLEAEVRSIITERLDDIAGVVADRIDVEGTVRSALDDQLTDAVDDRLAAALDDRLSEAIEAELADAIDQQVAAALDERAGDLTDAAADEAVQAVQSEMDSFEDDFMEKIQDVRDRVIQVKKEADRKAPTDHSHPEIDSQFTELSTDIEEVAEKAEEVGEEFADLRADIDAKLDNQEERLDDLDETVWDMQEKLRTVAYVVNDLRDSSAFENKRDTSVEQIKRAAAEIDTDRAQCEACGKGVSIALMTDPECPHCEATVTDVEPAEGFFGKPRLVKAQGIEAAAEPEDE